MRASRRRWNVWGALAILAPVLAVAWPAAAAEKVEYGLDWIVGGRHAAWFVALEKGFWKEAGLDVNVTRGFGSGHSIKRLVSRGDDFGFVAPGASMLARARGEKIKYIAVIYARAPYAVFSMAKTGLQKPKDLEGRLMGAPPGDGIRLVMPAFARHAGFDAGKVKWLDMPPSAKAASLLSGKVDGATNFLFDRIKYDREEKRHGKISMMLFADFGFELYANGVGALDEAVEKKPGVARGVVAGLVKGYEFTLKNPDEALAIIARRNPNISREIARGEIGLIGRLVLGPDQKKHCIGWMDAGKMADTVDIMFKAYNVEKKIDVKAGWTNDFVPCK